MLNSLLKRNKMNLKVINTKSELNHSFNKRRKLLPNYLLVQKNFLIKGIFKTLFKNLNVDNYSLKYSKKAKIKLRIFNYTKKFKI